ncbi:hypothetical protein [Bacillus sp. FJAT-28004]|uniref:hypothetical protein n=1 Tax=Bacillus sp. FJAT-28004 TaxID=1679165 RepID=UPI0006B50F5C|nr:hypothetical protein [Bacillus sp. FJAT-28004]
MSDAQIKIDGEWELEGFITQSNAEASIKYGFIGLGQGGSKIVDAFAGIRSKNGESVYKCLIVNSNLGDMKSLKNIPQRLKLSLKGFEKGVGKNPETGKEAFLNNASDIFDVISREMAGCDFIYVAAAFGGGTGTGSINVLVDAIADYLGKPVAAIASIPRPNDVESLNAYNALAELVPKLTDIRESEDQRVYRGLENVIILDNEKIVQDHIADPEVQGITWDYYSNYKIASVMHEINVATSLESEITLDAADLSAHVLKTGGILTFAKKKINIDNYKNNKDDLINEIISTYKGKNVLANGFDYQNDMKSMALIVVMPKERMDLLNQDTLEQIRSQMSEELPNVGFYPGFITTSSKRHAIIYTIASMGGLPERAKNLRQEAEELLKIKMLKEQQASGFQMGEKLTISSQAPTRKVGSNPFAQTASQPQNKVEESPKPIKATNPFRNL